MSATLCRAGAAACSSLLPVPRCCLLLAAACHGRGWPGGPALWCGAGPSVQRHPGVQQVGGGDWKFPLGSASVTLSLLF